MSVKESQVECSGSQSTGCLFRSAVIALVARHAHVGGDPLQDDDDELMMNVLRCHETY